MLYSFILIPSCFPSCFVVDTLTVLCQEFEEDYDRDRGSRGRALAGFSDDAAHDSAESFGRTLEASLSDGEKNIYAYDEIPFEGEEEEEYNKFGYERELQRRRRSRRSRNRVRGRSSGRCRSRCRRPIKSRDRRLLELQEEERMVDIKADAEIADYYEAVSVDDPHNDHRRLFGCEEILRRKFDLAAMAYNGPGVSAFYCISSIIVSSDLTNAPKCSTRDSGSDSAPTIPCYSQSWSSRSEPSRVSRSSGGKGDGKGDGMGDGKGGGKGNVSQRSRNRQYSDPSKGSRSGSGKGGGKGGYRSYYRYSYSKGSKSSF